MKPSFRAPGSSFLEQPVASSPAVAAQIVAAVGQTTQSLAMPGLRGDEPWGTMQARVTAIGNRVPLHGGSGTQGVLNAIVPGPLGPEGFSDIISGSAYIHVVIWEQDKLVARMVVANSVSGDPASPYRDDQLALFADKQLFAPPFSDAEISADPALQVRNLSE